METWLHVSLCRARRVTNGAPWEAVSSSATQETPHSFSNHKARYHRHQSSHMATSWGGRISYPRSHIIPCIFISICHPSILNLYLPAFSNQAVFTYKTLLHNSDPYIACYITFLSALTWSPQYAAQIMPPLVMAVLQPRGVRCHFLQDSGEWPFLPNVPQ